MPTMRQIKIGTYLRMERDKRTYGAVFKHRSILEFLLWVRAKSNKQLAENCHRVLCENSTVRYEGLGSYFHDLRGQSELVRHWLLTRRRSQESYPHYDIAIHFRSSDFSEYSPSYQGLSGRLPMSWYRDAYELSKEMLGVVVPKVVLFTDSKQSTLSEYLGIPFLVHDQSRDPLTALFRMASSKCLIASRSTFSMWAAYLGGQKVIWDSKFDIEPYYPTDPARDVFCEVCS